MHHALRPTSVICAFNASTARANSDATAAFAHSLIDSMPGTLGQSKPARHVHVFQFVRHDGR